MSRRLSVYDYDLLIDAVELVTLKFSHDEELIEEYEELRSVLQSIRPSAPEKYWTPHSVCESTHE